jgi:hypothetical protein
MMRHKVNAQIVIAATFVIGDRPLPGFSTHPLLPLLWPPLCVEGASTLTVTELSFPPGVVTETTWFSPTAWPWLTVMTICVLVLLFMVAVVPAMTTLLALSRSIPVIVNWLPGRTGFGDTLITLGGGMTATVAVASVPPGVVTDTTCAGPAA